MTFQDLGLCPQILSALRDLGYQKPSPIQEKAIPPALKGRDVLGCAQTGTGKTCAFAAPILQQLNARKAEPLRGVRPIRALILTPTRELALQIQESFEAYGKNLPLRSAVIFGGVGQQPQVDALKRGVDILVATPGRLEDLHNQGYIHVEKLEIFVLDEADRMLDMGFIHDVKKILTWLPKKKQTLFFSATMPPEVQHLVDSLLVDPVKVAVDPVSSPVEVIDQRLFYVDRGNKSKLLAMLVKHPDVKNALIFTRTKHGANKVAADLEKAGIHAAAIHGNKSQTARQQALSDFKAGKVKALVATDIAARGLDIEELSHVFNYNLPDVPETYVHRIGRTGRAGRGGTAVSFCEFGEKELLSPIEKLLKKPIPVVEGHPFPMEVFEAPKRDKHGKIVNADDAEARQAARERKKLREEAKKLPAQSLPPLGGRYSPVASAHRTTEPEARQVASAKPVTDEGAYRKPNKPQSPTSPAKKTAPQPSASIKKQAGYRASKTLEEALTAMSPRSTGASPKQPVGRFAKQNARDGRLPEGQMTSPAKPKGREDRGGSPRDAAFEAWLAEERKIQAQQYGRDPLAGEEIMDATARFLAPKGSKTPAPTRQEKPRQEQRQQEPSVPPKAKAQQQSNAKAQKPQQPKSSGAPVPQPPAPQKKQAVSSLKDRRREDRRPTRPHGPVEAPHSGAQKDSTEQRSLMKPYYFNPDEE